MNSVWSAAPISGHILYIVISAMFNSYIKSARHTDNFNNSLCCWMVKAFLQTLCHFLPFFSMMEIRWQSCNISDLEIHEYTQYCVDIPGHSRKLSTFTKLTRCEEKTCFKLRIKSFSEVKLWYISHKQVKLESQRETFQWQWNRKFKFDSFLYECLLS